MIKAVIFDCFGVLAQDAWFPFLNVYIKNSEIREQAEEALSRVGAGLISYEDFYEQLAKVLNVSQQEIKMKLTENPPDERLFEYIENNLKLNYKVGMLSNAGSNRMVELFGATRADLFDDVVLSYRFGMTKPEAAIYELAAKRLGVLPEECIFIDDQPRYCEGAEQVGMKSIHFEDTNQTIARIKELIGA
jgi:epoxide hydrolase-like predicted phosphatase